MKRNRATRPLPPLLPAAAAPPCRTHRDVLQLILQLSHVVPLIQLHHRHAALAQVPPHDGLAAHAARGGRAGMHDKV